MTDTFCDEMVALLPRLRRFAFGLTGVEDAADDLVQAACERALARRAQWSPGTRLDSWMYRIVQTIFLDQRRAEQVRFSHASVAAPEETGVQDGECEMTSRLMLSLVRRKIANLPEVQRVALLLVTVEGCSYKQAADILQIPVGTLMSRLGRARQTLAEHVLVRQNALERNR